ncbi:hypothetical protein GCM10010174_55560 [Kutzneria viridogrisea]|uniref:Calerythrin n=2 Tax=Kutzneria TaxID=43356 RepID=W5WAH3_9PSEU|nr:EF-hand domain-containing protein [Kutzneria albida]AHH95179.1 Calerythrin [Kutzneria albida DSM 43870]MBA8927464.1 Ca2+-binding EF-hand superfamily protein [Kutzneria viridogrisea]
MTTAVKNERLRKRFEKWDTNGDGQVDRADYLSEADRIVSAFGEDPSTPQARALKDAFAGMYDYLADKAGVGAAGSMSVDQFQEVVQAQLFAEGDAGFSRVVRPTISAIVGLCDVDGDGQINPEEFHKWLEAVGVDRSSAVESFRAIDTNGDGQLSVDELVQAVRDYHFGTLDVPLLG